MSQAHSGRVNILYLFTGTLHRTYYWLMSGLEHSFFPIALLSVHFVVTPFSCVLLWTVQVCYPVLQHPGPLVKS